MEIFKKAKLLKQKKEEGQSKTRITFLTDFKIKDEVLNAVVYIYFFMFVRSELRHL